MGYFLLNYREFVHGFWYGKNTDFSTDFWHLDKNFKDFLRKDADVIWEKCGITAWRYILMSESNYCHYLLSASSFNTDSVSAGYTRFTTC